MRVLMSDRRVLVAVVGAAFALVLGVVGVIIDVPALGAVGGLAAALAGAAAFALGTTADQTAARLAKAEHDRNRLVRELDASDALLQEHMNARSTASERAEQAFDPATGLYDARYFAVLVQQQVAAARRSLRPITVIIFEIDSIDETDTAAREQALGVVGDVVRRTLRESDSACCLGDLMIGAILEDTPEAGGVWAAERVRGTLLTSPVGDALTVSAGVACYPTHALGAAELVAKAGKALEAARARGADRVEIASEA